MPHQRNSDERKNHRDQQPRAALRREAEFTPENIFQRKSCKHQPQHNEKNRKVLSDHRQPTLFQELLLPESRCARFE